MQEVTCYRCRYVANLTPDAAKCPRCSTDLRTLIPPDEARSWFHDRAISFANRGESHLALAEVKRGIGYAESSELRLLAAIIARQMGDHEEMRQHLAVIPLGDRLRDEAEWLLRSQQRVAAKPVTNNKRATIPAVSAPVFAPGSVGNGNGYTKAPSRPAEKSWRTYDEANSGSSPSFYSASNARRNEPSEGRPLSSGGMAATMTLDLNDNTGQVVQDVVRNRLSPMLALLFCGAIGVLVWSLMQQGPITIEILPTPFPAVTLLPTPQPNGSITLPTATPFVDSGSAPEIEVPVDVASPPNETVPSDIAQNGALGAQPPQIAATDPAAGLDLSTPFNLLPYLISAGREDLAQLPVEAKLRNSTLLLSGEVTTSIARTALIEAAQAIPEISEVDAIAVLVRVPPTYIVQAGDNLWIIAYKFYGNEARRVDQIFALNADILPSAEYLREGMQLKLPKVED